MRPPKTNRPPAAEGRSNTLRRWTPSQRIRTAAAIPVIAALVDASSMPVYLEFAEKAAHLRELGMSDRSIAVALGVSDKTVAKAVQAARGPTSLSLLPKRGSR